MRQAFARDEHRAVNIDRVHLVELERLIPAKPELIWRPALFTSTSILPKRRAMSAMVRITAVSQATSQARIWTSPFEPFRSRPMTSAPASASALAVAFPMPLAAPVTMAFLPRWVRTHSPLVSLGLPSPLEGERAEGAEGGATATGPPFRVLPFSENPRRAQAGNGQ